MFCLWKKSTKKNETRVPGETGEGSYDVQWETRCCLCLGGWRPFRRGLKIKHRRRDDGVGTVPWWHWHRIQLAWTWCRAKVRVSKAEWIEFRKSDKAKPMYQMTDWHNSRLQSSFLENQRERKHRLGGWMHPKRNVDDPTARCKRF